MFVVPFQTQALLKTWSNLEETSELSKQQHKWWQATYRILLKDSLVCIAEAKDEEGLDSVWKEACQTVEDTKACLCSKRVSGWLLQEVFADKVYSKDGNAPADKTIVPVVNTAVFEHAIDAQSWQETVEIMKNACQNSSVSLWYNAKDTNQQSLLHFTCTYKKESLVRKLVAQGADVNALDYQGWTPLHVACDGGNLASANVLLQNGALVMLGTKTEGNIALHYLARHNADHALWEQVAQTILDKGCSVNSENYFGETPMQRACSKGLIDTVAWLKKQGAHLEGVVKKALRAPNVKDMIRWLIEHGAVVDEDDVTLALSMRLSKTVQDMLTQAEEADAVSSEALESTAPKSPTMEMVTDTTPCGICGNELGQHGPPLGCVMCSKVRCFRCIVTVGNNAICLSCSALSKEHVSLTGRDLPPTPPGSPRGTWSWGSVLGVFQGWRIDQPLPGSSEACQRFSLPSDSLLLDAWACTISGVCFHLFAFSTCFCFAIATVDSSKKASDPRPTDLTIPLGDVETLSARENILILQSAKLGLLEVVPLQEPAHWLSNVCLWLWTESRSMNPDVRQELVGFARDPDFALSLQTLFPQCASEYLTCTYEAKLSLHSGPPLNGRLYLTPSHLCFAQNKDPVIPSPRTNRASRAATTKTLRSTKKSISGEVPSTTTSAAGALSNSDSLFKVEEKPMRKSSPSMSPKSQSPRPSPPKSPRGRTRTMVDGRLTRAMGGPGVGGAASLVANNNTSQSANFPFLPEEISSNTGSAGSLVVKEDFQMQLILDFAEDVTSVEKEGSEFIVVRGAGGTWTLNVGPSTSHRDTVWNAIRGSFETCTNHNTNPNLPNVLIIDDEHVHTVPVISAIIQHSLKSLVTVATYNHNRTALLSSYGCSIWYVESVNELVDKMKDEFQVVIMGSPASSKHPSFPLNFLSILNAKKGPVPRIVVTAPFVRCDDCDALLRPSHLLAEELDCFDNIETCLIRYVPFFQDIFNAQQYLASVNRLHVPIHHIHSKVPLVSMADFVDCIRIVTLFKPHALYVPGSFVMNSPNAPEFVSVVEMASVSLDRVIQISAVEKEDFAENYCPDLENGLWKASVVGQWDENEDCFPDSHISLIKGSVPLPLPQFLHDSKAAILESRNSSYLIQELAKRWNASLPSREPQSLPNTGATNSASNLPPTQSSGELPPLQAESMLLGLGENALSIRQALVRALKGENGVPVRRDVWISVMHLLHGGPDRVALELMYWSSLGLEQSMTRKIFQEMLRDVEESWTVLGLNLQGWKEKVEDQVFQSDEKSLDLSTWIVRMRKAKQILHSADCLSFRPMKQSSDDDIDSTRLPIIGPWHPEFNTMRYLLLAFRIRLAEAEVLRKSSLTVAASTSPSSLAPVSVVLPWLPNDTVQSVSFNRQSQTIPPNVVGFWTCVEPCPALFRRVRDASKVEYNEFIKWLGPTQLLTCLLRGRMGGLQEIYSSSRSGSLFFRSRNGRYLLKTLPPAEDNLLVQFMPEYCAYLDQNPGSFLPRYLSLIRMHSPAGRMISFVVMLSVFGGPVTEQYDLKGSKIARQVGGTVDPFVARKDLDLTQKLRIGRIKKRQVLAHLERDTYWMCSRNICDYSLLIGFAKDKEIPEVDGVLMAFQSVDKSRVYYVGLIDTLTLYDMKKRGEHVMKSIIHDSAQISAVDSVSYRLRFIKHMEEIFE